MTAFFVLVPIGLVALAWVDWRRSIRRERARRERLRVAAARQQQMLDELYVSTVLRTTWDRIEMECILSEIRRLPEARR